MHSRWMTGLALLAMAGAAPAAGDGWVALVTSVQGNVHAVRAADHRDVRLHTLSKVHPDDKLVLDDGATVTLSFLHGGKRVTVTGGSAEVAADHVNALHATEEAASTYPIPLMPSGVNAERGGSAPPLLVLAEEVPVVSFDFLATPDVTSYDVQIRNVADSQRTVLTLPGQRHAVTLDAATLKRYQEGDGDPIAIHPEQRYMVDVTAHHARGPEVGATFVVSLLRPRDSARLDSAVSAARRDYHASRELDPTSFALASSLYEESSSYGPALERLRELSHQYPDCADYLEQLQDGVAQELEEIDARARQAHDDGAFDPDGKR